MNTSTIPIISFSNLITHSNIILTSISNDWVNSKEYYTFIDFSGASEGKGVIIIKNFKTLSGINIIGLHQKIILDKNKFINFGKVEWFPNAIFLGNDININKTELNLDIKKESIITAKIFSLRGEVVKIFYIEQVFFGQFHLEWTGEKDDGNFVTPGIYLFQLIINRDNKRYMISNHIVVAK